MHIYFENSWPQFSQMEKLSMNGILDTNYLYQENMFEWLKKVGESVPKNTHLYIQEFVNNIPTYIVIW